MWNIFRKQWWVNRWVNIKSGLVKEALMGEPWDYTYLLELEYKKICCMIENYSHPERVVCVEGTRLQILKTLRWAKYCLEVMTEKVKLEELTYIINGKEYDQIPDNISVEDWFDDKIVSYKWTCLKYVNIKNSHRFIKRTHSNIELHKSALYNVKAHDLYYKIRQQYTELWWD